MNSILNSAFHVLKESGKANDETKTYIWNFEMSNKFSWTRLTEQENFFSFTPLKAFSSVCLAL